MMNRKILSFLSVAALALIFSCTRQEVSVEGEYGYLTVGLSDSETSDDLVQMRARSAADDKIYRLEIYDADGNMDFSIDDHTALSPEHPIRLLMGKYDVHAVHGIPGTAFNSPCYGGSNSVRIYAESEASVDITCRMKKVKFSVHFPEDADFAAKFKLYELAVTGGNETLTFSSQPHDGDPTYGSFLRDTAYFEVPADKKLTYTLRMINADNATYTTTRVVENVAAAEHYHFNFRLGEQEDIDGALVLDIVLDGEYDNVVSHNIILNFDKTLMPSYSTNDAFVPVPADGSVPVWPLNNDTPKIFTFNAPRGIRNLVISHLDADLLAEGLPQLVDFIGIKPDEQQIMSDIGVTYSLVDATKAQIDITEFIKNMHITPDGETYLMSLTVIDEYDRFARCDFEFTIVSDIQAETGSCFRWSSWAEIRGRYFSKTPPSGMSFLYRKASESEWTKVDPSMISIDTQSMTFSYRLNHLDFATEYVYMATSDKDVADGKSASEQSFTTYANEGTVYNLSFDDWWENDGAWYPTVNNSQYHVWDTANEGTAGLGTVPTTPERSLVIRGSAAKMVSSKAMGQFAAGNIYTGDFGSATLNPVGAKLNWGVPFSSRPLALRGWYRYEPVNIDNTSSGYSHLKGQPDFCQIQIFLTTWGGPFEISTGDNRFVDTSTKNKDIIAFGQIVSQDNTTDNAGNRNGYIQFTIPLQYRNLNQPTYIVISGAASRYGDYFTGGLGSTFYLDELELVYDPDELTPQQLNEALGGVMQ